MTQSSKIIGYIRVSHKDQNLDRQRDAMQKIGVTDIYEDKQTGKDMDRQGYQYMKKALREGDTVIFTSIDRLGRNRKMILEEWRWFTENKINVRILDMPILDKVHTEKERFSGMEDFIQNLILEVIALMAEQERENTKRRQKEGIAAAKARGKVMGRPKFGYKELSDPQKKTIEYNYPRWIDGEIKAVEFMKMTDLKKSTFYKIMKEYEEMLK